MRNHPATRVPVAVTVLSLLACLFVWHSRSSDCGDQAGDQRPGLQRSVGTPAQQEAVFTQLISLINATPAGETIRSSMFELEDSAVASALIAAHERVVDRRLRRSVRGRRCGRRQPRLRRHSPPNPAYNHNKFFIFSKIGPFDDGTSYDKVVFQSSSNLNDWYKVESYNDAITFVDARVYDGYAKFHDDQRRLRHSASGDNTVPVLGLMSAGCAEACREARQGGWVDVVYSQGDARMEAILDDAGIQRLYCNFNNGPGIDVRTHTKFCLIDGDSTAASHHGCTRAATTGRVLAFGPRMRRWSGSPVPSNHASYLSYFYKIRDTCRDRMG